MSDWTNVNCVQAGDAKKTPGTDIRAAQPTGKESVHACMVSICIADKTNIVHVNFKEFMYL